MKKLLLLLLLTITTFANIGTVMAVNGEAQIKRINKTIHITSGMNLYKGDEIITNKKTKVQVMLNDDTAITIGPNSSFSFLEYFFDGSKQSTISMKASRGFFRSVTGKIGKIAPERFKVQTNLATIGIRGTDFSVQMDKNRAFYKCNRGKITVSFQDKMKEVIAGDALQLHRNGMDIDIMPLEEIKTPATVNVAQYKIKTEDVAEIKEDIKNIKYDCQHN